MSTNRYSALNRRPAATSSLFQDYPGSRPTSSTSQTRSSPYNNSPRASSPYTNSSSNPSQLYNSYPNGGNNSHGQGYKDGYSNGKLTPPLPSDTHAFHSASPNSKGQYSTSVLESLESQNDNEQTSILSQKVSQLKSLTIAIGDEIRDSSSLAAQINDQFENTGVRLKGTWKRMLRAADRTGIGWRVWLVFFVVVWLLFVWVWLF